MTATGTQPGLDYNDRRLLEEIRDTTRTTALKLFGHPDGESENETGRLPKVESSAKSAHGRIDELKTETDHRFQKVERKIIYAKGFIAAVTVCSSAFTGIVVFVVETYMRVNLHK